MSAMVLAHGNVAGRRDILFTLGITLLVQTAVSLLATSVAVLAPAISHERGWNLSFVALYAPLVYGAAFFIGFRIPWLLSKLGGMRLALGAVMAEALGLVCLLSAWPPMAILAALFIGVGWGAITPASSHLLGPRTTAQNAGVIMSIKQAGVPAGAMLAGLVLPYLLSS
jgi:MFS family permease